ncbi:hypothetical protein [Bosea sp. (in: a-proteobacteria)]|uniref:hypothetical protein n=1 Tax=Bosea sp. (in: a-proteobacteria) TaxID=1871050 RepID=UPI003341169B
MPSYALFDDLVVARTDAATSGWINFTDLQAVFDFAHSQDRPLFFRPGIYDSGTVTILPSNGGGKPLQARAMPGSVVLRFNGMDHFLVIDGQARVRFEGLSFDGQNRALSDYVSGRPAFIVVANGAKDVAFEDCRILYSPGIGVYVTDAEAAFGGPIWKAIPSASGARTAGSTCVPVPWP